MPQFPDQLAAAQAHVEVKLRDILDHDLARGTPERLSKAMRHAVLGGGKRFRPFLVLESASLFGVNRTNALNAAAAVEFIHCYSLVHDDLPSMDNDELRRGQPTVWKAFDEWTAILAGDGLQSLAFEILCADDTHLDGAVRAALVRALAVAGGPAGMVGGQALDLEAGAGLVTQAADAAHVAKLQDMKTGKLISVSCEMGAILGRADETQRKALIRYGDCLGFAFQISDDLLDAEGSAADVGKATGKDAAAGKATLVSLVGIARAREHLDHAIQTAISSLAAFGPAADALRAAATFLGRREY